METEKNNLDAKEFAQLLPKIELHAHINGSLSDQTLLELGCQENMVKTYQSLVKMENKEKKSMEYCFSLFKIAQQYATSSPKAVYIATKRVIEDFANENVIYLELRTTPRAENCMTKQEYIESVVKAIKDNKLNIIVKLILSIDRRHDSNVSYESLDIMLKMRDKYPDFIKGIDFSGNPNEGIFDSNLFNKARAKGLKTTIHCAEVKNDKEVEEILKFTPDRLGHATYLHPSYGGSKSNWELYQQHKIPIECCMTSNVVCGTSESYHQHHMGEWLKYGLPFSVNTDDKGIFDTTLSNEYELASKHFLKTPNDLWKAAYNAIDFTFATKDENVSLRDKMLKWYDTHYESSTWDIPFFVK